MQLRWCTGVLGAALSSFTRCQGVLRAAVVTPERLRVLQVPFPCAVMSRCLTFGHRALPLCTVRMWISALVALYLCLCCLVNWAGTKWHRLKLYVTLNIGLMIKQNSKKLKP